MQLHVHSVSDLASPIELIDEHNIWCPQCWWPFGIGPRSLAGALKNLHDNYLGTKACRDNMQISGWDRNPTKQKGILVFFSKGKSKAIPTTTPASTIVPSHSGTSSQMLPISISMHANQDSTTPPSELPPPAPISKTNEPIDILESSIVLLPKDFPVTAPSNILAAFSRDPPALYDDPTIASADLWEEILNQKMHIFLRKSDLELVPLVHVGENRISGFCRFVHYFVGQCGVDPMLFDSQVQGFTAAIQSMWVHQWLVKVPVTHYQDSLAKDKPLSLVGIDKSEEWAPQLQSPNDDATASSSSSSRSFRHLQMRLSTLMPLCNPLYKLQQYQYLLDTVKDTSLPFLMVNHLICCIHLHSIMNSRFPGTTRPVIVSCDFMQEPASISLMIAMKSKGVWPVQCWGRILSWKG